MDVASAATDHSAQFPAGDSKAKYACPVCLRRIRVFVSRCAGFVHACYVVVCVRSRIPQVPLP